MKPVNKDTGLVAINVNRVCHPRNLNSTVLTLVNRATNFIGDLKLVIIKIPCIQLSIRILYFKKTYEFCVPRYKND